MPPARLMNIAREADQSHGKHQDSTGVYRLAYKITDMIPRVSPAGRFCVAERDVRRSFASTSDERCCSSVEAAFPKECVLFHDIKPPGNSDTP